MKSFMLDSMIFDKIIGVGKEKVKTLILELRSSKQIKILITYIQIDQLNDTPDAARRKKLLECTDEICECIPTCGFVLGVSKLGEAKLSSRQKIEEVRQGKGTLNKKQYVRWTKDALIASTANSDADFLVTDDDPFAKRLKKRVPSVQILNFNEFVRTLYAIAGRNDNSKLKR